VHPPSIFVSIEGVIVSEFGLRITHTLSSAAIFPETQLSACSPNHFRTKFLSISDGFRAAVI
jgi:hypothetical protein